MGIFKNHTRLNATTARNIARQMQQCGKTPTAIAEETGLSLPTIIKCLGEVGEICSSTRNTLDRSLNTTWSALSEVEEQVELTLEVQEETEPTSPTECRALIRHPRFNRPVPVTQVVIVSAKIPLLPALTPRKVPFVVWLAYSWIEWRACFTWSAARGSIQRIATSVCKTARAWFERPPMTRERIAPIEQALNIWTDGERGN